MLQSLITLYAFLGFYVHYYASGHKRGIIRCFLPSVRLCMYVCPAPSPNAETESRRKFSHAKVTGLAFQGQKIKCQDHDSNVSVRLCMHDIWLITQEREVQKSVYGFRTARLTRNTISRLI